MNSDDWKAILAGGVNGWLRQDYPGSIPTYIPTSGTPSTWNRVEQVPPSTPSAADIQAPGLTGGGAVNFSNPWVIGGAVLVAAVIALAVAKS